MATSVLSFLTRGLSALWLLLLLFPAALATYSIGVGRADCTGPTADIVFVSIKFCVLSSENSNEKVRIKYFGENKTIVGRWVVAEFLSRIFMFKFKTKNI